MPAEPRAPSLWRRLWEGWKVVAHRIGTFQAKVILGILYLVVLGPVAIVRRLVADPLCLRPVHQPTYWIRRASTDDTLERARRQ